MGKRHLLFGFALIYLLSGCGPQLIPLDDDSVVLDPGVEIVYPLDQDILGPYHAAVVAAASLPAGIGGMEFSIDGNPPTLYEFPAHKIGSDYVENYAYWFPAHTGSTILSVVVFDMNGQPALSDQIEVFVEFEDPMENDAIETYIAQTLTAIAQELDEFEVVEPTATTTPTPTPDLAEANSPCDLFDTEETKLTLHDIQPSSNQLTFFLTFGFEVPGLEARVEGDNLLYIYTAQIGSGEPVECSYQGYPHRLYCTTNIPGHELDSAQPLTVELNLCESPIYAHPRVSIIAPVCSGESKQSSCEAFGGDYRCVRDTCSCVCP